MAKGLSRSVIVDAALAVLDDDGIDGVTVRAVAQRLDVKAPALYWHVAGKQELLDEMGTEIQRRVIQELVARLDEKADWREGLTTYARVLREEYLAHRDGARTFSGTRLTDPEVLRAQEPWLQRWVDQGLSIQDATDAATLVTSFVVGFVIEEQERAQGGQQRYSLSERDANVGPDAPLVHESGRIIYDDPSARFERLVNVLLDGLAATMRSGA
ncbi:MAG: TetR/AcrR family transcriptional regulator C-terminal domain-containing protein [Nocardioides sp.]|uniref:TetR/AcrR family transcriptional regulator C-terminal domain-containing protein n=1 Tax=Nocardioides sp. TaxID=35761 RepID=UPI0039E2F40A